MTTTQLDYIIILIGHISTKNSHTKTMIKTIIIIVIVVIKTDLHLVPVHWRVFH